MPTPQYVRLDEWEFQERYQALLDDNGGYRQLHPAIESERRKLLAAQSEHRVWTILDTDGFVSISSGWHVVNRIAHIITERPFDPRQEIEVYDPEELLEWEQRVKTESAD